MSRPPTSWRSVDGPALAAVTPLPASTASWSAAVQAEAIAGKNLRGSVLFKGRCVWVGNKFILGVCGPCGSSYGWRSISIDHYKGYKRLNLGYVRG
jgi:hypothetical protein